MPVCFEGPKKTGVEVERISFLCYHSHYALFCILRFPQQQKNNTVPLYMQLFAGALISYLRYLCLFALLKIYIVIVHGSVLINDREYRRGH
jgi:hypothetical protein